MKHLLKASVLVLTLMSFVALGQAPGEDKLKRAKKICEGLTGVICERQLVEIMTAFLDQNAPLQAALAAIDYNDNFYKKLKNQVHKLSNEDRVERGALNSFTALILGLTRDEIPFDKVLYGDIIYTADGAAEPGTVPPFNPFDNRHYEEADNRGLAYKDTLVKKTQSELGMFPSEIAAGVLTTPTFGDSYFKAGTNRAVLAYTYDGFLCHSIEQLHDNTRPKHFISKDVTFAPGGDPSVYLSTCSGCHSGMDAQRPAFAYWDYVEGLGLTYDPTRIPEKLTRNAEENPNGFEIRADKWTNLWTEGKNATLGWNGATEGNGLKAWGKMLSQSNAFAQCWSRRALTGVCLIDPETTEGILAINQLASTFKRDGNYNLKRLYAKAALLCSQ